VIHDVQEGITGATPQGNTANGTVAAPLSSRVLHSIHHFRLAGFKNFQFTIIEEKRKDIGTKTLKDCKPQVTGEALALYVTFLLLYQSQRILKF
jgi:hypothetical protein